MTAMGPSRMKIKLFLPLFLSACASSGVTDWRTELVLGDDYGAQATVYLPEERETYAVTLMTALDCDGPVFNRAGRSTVNKALENGSAVVIMPIPCGGEPLGYRQFQAMFERVQNETARLGLDWERLTIIGHEQ